MIAVLLVSFAMPTFAASVQDVPYDTYTYINSADGRTAVYSKAVYETSQIIDGVSLGISNINEIRDIFITDNNEIFVLDGVTGQIIVLKEDFSLNYVISSFNYNGEPIELNAAEGIFVDQHNTLWIADTENKRVLNTDLEGKVLGMLETPSGELIPENFTFYPMRVACDSKGFVYVVCRGSYYGAMIFERNGNFVSFFGANKVKTDFITGIQRIFQRMFVSNEKLAVSVQKLPYQFLDFKITKEDFVYTVSSSKSGQVRKLGPNGDNSLYNGAVSSDSYNFGDEKTYFNNYGIATEQNLTSIDVDNEGNIFILDSNYGRIYVYDKNCKNICVFGGGISKGFQEGTFTYPSALSCYKDGVLVADKLGGNLTYFTLTDYGRTIMTAEKFSNAGEYDKAIPEWEKVLAEDTSCQIAYTYLSKCYYALEDYDKAMECARKGMDQTLYAQAFKEVSEEFVTRNFGWIFPLIIVAVVALFVFIYISIKKQIILIKNEKLRLAFNVIAHPFDTFNEIKYKKKGSTIIATVAICLFYIVTILGKEYGGFMYSLPGKSGIDSFFTLISTAGIVVLFVIVNWAFSVLFEGKGKFGEIYIATAYSLLPMIVYRIIFIVGSYLSVPGEVDVLTALSTVCLIATFLLLIIGQIVIHDFSLWKTLAIGALSIVGMVIIGLLVFVVIMLWQNVLSFIVSIYSEAFLR